LIKTRLFFLQLSNRIITHKSKSVEVAPNDQAQRPPPETPGRLQQSLTNHLNRSTAQRGGGSLQRIDTLS
jgi:hypothetical protein